jgi:signal transduction histidine kinase
VKNYILALKPLWVAYVLTWGIGLSSSPQNIYQEPKSEVFQRAIAEYETAQGDSALYETTRALYRLYQFEDITLAKNYIEETLQHARRLEDPIRIIYAHSELGSAYSELGEFDNAFDQYASALSFSNISGISSEIFHTNYHIGTTYTDIQISNVAEPLLQSAVENYNDDRSRWAPRYQLAQLYLSRGDTLKARESLRTLQATLGDVQEYNDIYYLYDAVLLTDLLIRLKKLDEANEILNTLQPLIEQVDLRLFNGIYLLSKSKIELFSNNLESALAHGEQALEQFRLQHDNSSIMQSLHLLTDVHNRMGNPAQAFRYLNEYDKLQSKNLTQRNRAVVSTITEQAKATQDAETELQKSEALLKQRNIYNLALFLLLVGVCVLLVIIHNTSKARRNAAYQLEEINEEKDHFIGVVSHDLRSPLNSIMVLSSMMVEDAENTDADTLKEYNSIIVNSAKNMEHLISNMLDANKIETGNTSLKVGPVKLQDAIKSPFNSTTVLGKEKNISTELNIEENLPEVIAESQAISRILENLMSNAYKFSPSGSTITVSLSEQGEQVQLAVEDQGPGLTDLDRKKLFTKFEKLSASPTANEKTTGLGLFIVKNLVQEMNGTILVESDYGNGTTFKILFNKA